MDKQALKEFATMGIMEAVTNHTIFVDVSLASQQPDWGTGSLIKIKNRLFIATCKHVVKPGYRNEDLRVTYRATSAVKWLKKEKIKKEPLNKLQRELKDTTFPKKISVIDRFYSDELDDLALIELDPAIEGHTDGSQFFPVTAIETPKTDMPVFLMGFSVELTRQDNERRRITVFPYFEATHIVNVNLNSRDFNSKKHFLMDFKITKDAADPRGLSGCGVWTRLLSGEKLWTPNLRLVGVQHGHYSARNVLVATRIERLMKLIE